MKRQLPAACSLPWAVPKGVCADVWVLPSRKDPGPANLPLEKPAGGSREWWAEATSPQDQLSSARAVLPLVHTNGRDGAGGAYDLQCAREGSEVSGDQARARSLLLGCPPTCTTCTVDVVSPPSSPPPAIWVVAVPVEVGVTTSAWVAVEVVVPEAWDEGGAVQGDSGPQRRLLPPWGASAHAHSFNAHGCS